MGKALTEERKAQVASQLQRVSGSGGFSGAPRLMKLLRYLVLAEAEGIGDDISQNGIAMKVMDRGAEFDPSVDSVVRVEAGRLRTKLRDYYETEGRNDPIRFDLPKGRYNPNIVFVSTASESLEQEIRFLKTEDRTTIAYAVSGKGKPIIKAANWLSHLEFDLTSPVWRHWWTEIGGRFRLIRYDERGCGLSDWEVEPPDFCVETWVSDLETVVETVEEKQFALLGISQGAAVAMAYAVQHPERVSHLILYGGFAQGRLKRNPSSDQIEEAALLKQLVSIGWGQNNPAFRKTFAALFAPDASADQIEAFDALQRVSTSPANAEKFLDAFNNIDVLELAAQVTVPTLVLHARDELEIPMAQGRLLASTIPGAKLVSLDSRNHILGENEPAWQEFLKELAEFTGSGDGE